jgi:hypothetical protein
LNRAVQQAPEPEPEPRPEAEAEAEAEVEAGSSPSPPVSPPHGHGEAEAGAGAGDVVYMLSGPVRSRQMELLAAQELRMPQPSHYGIHSKPDQVSAPPTPTHLHLHLHLLGGRALLATVVQPACACRSPWLAHPLSVCP